MVVGCEESEKPSSYISNIGIRVVPDGVTTLTNVTFNPIKSLK